MCGRSGSFEGHVSAGPMDDGSCEAQDEGGCNAAIGQSVESKELKIVFDYNCFKGSRLKLLFLCQIW